MILTTSMNPNCDRIALPVDMRAWLSSWTIRGARACIRVLQNSVWPHAAISRIKD